jgi:hypothetical protein
MATIFNPINKPIADQIDVRQNIMAGNVTNQHARNTYLNKACVVKLIPLVKDTSLQPTNYNDFIFDNFTLKDNFFNSRDFKYNDKVEKPFIQNIEITSRSGNNYGATRTGKLTLIIPTKNQFNSIERYFRIGTAFLLEWGWGTYVDNNGSVESISFVEENKYNGEEVDEVALENAILKQREDNKGNYDGGIFFITNFTTNIQNNTTDYYYELTLNLVSKGDILNSLEPNTPPVIDPDSESSTPDDKIKNNRLINYLDNLEKNIAIANIENLLNTAARTSLQRLLTEEGTTQTGTIDTPSDLSVLNPNDNFIKIEGIKTTEYRARAAGGTAVVEAIPITISESKSYVKLRFILNLLSALVENSSEYVEQDQTYGLPLYYCTLEPSTPNPTFYKWKWEPYNHFASFNPERVVLPHYLLRDPITVSSIQRFLLKEKDSDRFKIGGILVRTKFLIDEISNLIKDNKFSFNNILDLILRETNQWTDNELNLIKYDIDGTNRYTITSLKSTDDLNENISPKLKLYGKGSIVEQVDIDTVISNELSSQVAIMMNGSTNYKIDPMATSLLKFNTGIKSRLKRSEVTPNRRNPGGYLGAIKTIHERNHRFLLENSVDVPPYQDSLDQFRKFKQDYSDAIVENSAYDGIQGTPLFPIKIRTTLPGISGIVIGNKLKIEDVRLPDIYTSNKVYYVVTNQQSKIENRYWQTFLDLSPQINTDVKGKSTQDVENPNVVQNPEIPPVNIELLLDVIKQIESGGETFKDDIGPEWRPVRSTTGGTTYLGQVPLYSGLNPGSVSSTAARGPYQLQPAAFVDAMRELRYPENEIAKVAKNTSTDPSKPKWEWAYPSKFEPIIDTIGNTRSRNNARALAKAYTERYQKQLPSNIPATYLRLLTIYHLGGPVGKRDVNNSVFTAELRKEKIFASYKDYIIKSRNILRDNLKVPATELNDSDILRVLNLPPLQ